VGDGAAEERGERGRCRGRKEERREFCVRLSRERDCTMVGPLYRDPRPAAQLLISSTAHQSLVHDPPSRKVFLSLSLPAPISQPQPGHTLPLESYLETADGPRSEARREERANAFIYALGFEQSSRSKVDEDRRGVEERE